MPIERPILRYHGGKFLLAPWIISHFPPHSNYVECFGGAGSVLLRKRRSSAEVYNDKWDMVVNLFKILRDDRLAEELRQQLILTPFSREEFEDAYTVDIEQSGMVERARIMIIRSYMGFGSAGVSRDNKTGFRIGNRFSDGTNVGKDWAGYPDHIEAVVNRLRGVVIENRDYRDLFRMLDGPETLFFLDPPYVQETRNMARGNTIYAHEFSDQDHIDMAFACYPLKGTVIICGYESDMYIDLFKGWRMVKRKAFADGAAERTECLWINRQDTRSLFPDDNLYTTKD